MPHSSRIWAVCVLLLSIPLVSPDQVRAQSVELAERGKRIFTEGAEPACALCHTLADAGAAGEVGPNLDELKPMDEERVRGALTRGVGNMPVYETLSKEQVDAVAHYVAKVAGRSK